MTLGSRPACSVATLALLASTACSSSMTQPTDSEDAAEPSSHHDSGARDASATSKAHDARADGHSPDARRADAARDGSVVTDATDARDDRDAKSLATSTAAGVPLPQGWSLQVEDRFGTAPTQNVTTMAQLHAKYYEGQFYNRDANGLVKVPNVVINMEQETYEHFETVVVFAADHLTIQGRGHPDGSITSGELVSIYRSRSFCVEGRYQIPSVDKSWPAFWWYGDADGNDKSEIDFEQPVTPNQGVHDVSLHNHPTEGTVTILDSHFTTAYMTWSNPAFDASTAPHTYTACYDDGTGELTRYIDALAIYSDAWKWNASIGGTGNGPDPATIVNLAVGGDWPGNVVDPASYSADLDLYSIGYYAP